MVSTNTHAKAQYNKSITGTAVLVEIADSIINQKSSINLVDLHESEIRKIPKCTNIGTSGTIFSYGQSIWGKSVFDEIENEPVVPMPAKRSIKVRFRRVEPLRFSSVEDESGFLSK